MDRINVREFRATFGRLTMPVEVLRGTETIGVYYPNGTNRDVTPGLPGLRAFPLLDELSSEVDSKSVQRRKNVMAGKPMNDGLSSEPIPSKSVSEMRPDQVRAAQRTKQHELLSKINGKSK